MQCSNSDGHHLRRLIHSGPPNHRLPGCKKFDGNSDCGLPASSDTQQRRICLRRSLFNSPARFSGLFFFPEALRLLEHLSLRWLKVNSVISCPDDSRYSPFPSASLSPRVLCNHYFHQDISPSLPGECVKLRRRNQRRLRTRDRRICVVPQVQ